MTSNRKCVVEKKLNVSCKDLHDHVYVAIVEVNFLVLTVRSEKENKILKYSIVQDNCNWILLTFSLLSVCRKVWTETHPLLLSSNHLQNMLSSAAPFQWASCDCIYGTLNRHLNRHREVSTRCRSCVLFFVTMFVSFSPSYLYFLLLASNGGLLMSFKSSSVRIAAFNELNRSDFWWLRGLTWQDPTYSTSRRVFCLKIQTLPPGDDVDPRDPGPMGALFIDPEEPLDWQVEYSLLRGVPFILFVT